MSVAMCLSLSFFAAPVALVSQAESLRANIIHERTITSIKIFVGNGRKIALLGHQRSAARAYARVAPFGHNMSSAAKLPDSTFYYPRARSDEAGAIAGRVKSVTPKHKYIISQ